MTKKFTRKLLLLLLAIAATLCLVFGLTACGGGSDSVDSGTVSGNTNQSGSATDDNSGNNNDDGKDDKSAEIYYTLSESGDSYIVDWVNNSEYLITLTIPETYNGLPVTAIGDYAFYGCTALTSVYISDSVTSIGDSAFYECTSLENLTIESDVTIGNYAFSSCTSLENLTIDSDITLENGAFSNCTSLKNLIIESDATIKDLAFYDCTSLKNITIADTARPSIGQAFEGCSVESITLPYDCLLSNYYQSLEHIFGSYPDSLKSVTITSGNICSGALRGCPAETLTIGENVEYIDSYAFWDCYNLTEVNYNATEAETSSSNKFLYAGENSGGITVNIGVNVKIIPDYMFGVPDIYYSDNYITSVEFAENCVCESIGKRAFSNCKFTKIEIPENVTTIGDFAFLGCGYLENIYYNATAANDLSSEINVFPSSGYSSNGITVTIGANVTKIPAYLFTNNNKNCSVPNITSVVFENGSLCESIGDYAFAYCTALTSVTNMPSTTAYSTTIFTDCTSLDLTQFYKVYNNVNYFGTQMMSVADTTAEYIIVKDGTTTIEANAFSGCTKLRLVYIPESVTQIGSGALDCGAGSDLIIYFGASSIPSGYTSWLGQYAYTYESGGSTASANIYYSYCTGISISGDYLYSGSTLYAYFGTASTVTFPSELGGTTIKKIGNSATVLVTSGVSYVKPLSSFIGAKNITCPATITEVENYAFYNNTDIESIKFLSDSGSLLIDSAAFYGCTNLNSVTFTEGAKLQLQWASFYGCTSLTSIIIPSTANVINLEAFEDSGLTSITFTGFTIASLLNSDATSSISLTLSDYTSAQLAVLITTTYSDYNWTLWALNI